MSSYMCADCGERVDEELSMPDGGCNWCAVYDAKTGEQYEFFRIRSWDDLKGSSVELLKNHKVEVWEYYKMVKRVLEYKELDNE